MMPITNVADLQRFANNALRQAMIDERSKRWPQVVQSYRRLLRMLNKDNLPSNFEAPPWFSMLLYECHYHLGLALQQVGEHKKAVTQFTRAIQAVFIPKNGCLAGCNTSTCLMTPLYTRRAFAYAKSGDLKNAVRDAEKAVVLDNKNPDVLCIRALIRLTRQEDKEALKDVQTALRFNPNHLCALILRGGIEQPLTLNAWMGDTVANSEEHKQEQQEILSTYQQKACHINPDCHNFLSVKDVHHPEIIAFYDRFLYSLSIPHTISELHLPVEMNKAISVSNQSVSTNPMKILQEHRWHSPEKPFRCGTQIDLQHEKSTRQRRKDYAESVRDYMTKPQNAAQYLAFLEKERLRRRVAQGSSSASRPGTAIIVTQTIKQRPMSGVSIVSCPPAINCSRPGSVKAQNFRSALLNKCIADTDAGSVVSHVDSRHAISEYSYPASQKQLMRKASSVNAFQSSRDIEDAPRMYYKPWLGDKLPVAEVDRKKFVEPPFKV